MVVAGEDGIRAPCRETDGDPPNQARLRQEVAGFGREGDAGDQQPGPASGLVGAVVIPFLLHAAGLCDHAGSRCRQVRHRAAPPASLDTRETEWRGQGWTGAYPRNAAGGGTATGATACVAGAPHTPHGATSS